MDSNSQSSVYTLSIQKSKNFILLIDCIEKAEVPKTEVEEEKKVRVHPPSTNRHENYISNNINNRTQTWEIR